MNGEEDSDQLSSQFLRREFVVSGQALWQWRNTAQQQAIAANIAPNEVDWLLQEIAGLDRLALRLETFKDQTAIPLTRSLFELTTLWQQRTQDHVPVQYLTGVTPWRQFSLNVSSAVLIPRPETEGLIDLAIAAVKDQGTEDRGQGTGGHRDGETRGWGNTNALTQNSTLNTQNSSPHPSPLTPHSSPFTHWADLGTGSGAIALGLATAFPHASIHAVDCSLAALAIAQSNAQKLNLTEHIQFYQGNWFQPLDHLKGKLSGMIANPPYIPSGMVPALQPEVAQHEPHLALDGGADGLDCIRQLVTTAPDYLQSGGVWLIEMMAGQAIAVAELLHQQGSYDRIQIHADLAGIDRFALAYRV